MLFLLFAVAAYRIGVLLPIPLPVTTVLSTPLPRTVPADLAIFEISSELLLPVLTAPVVAGKAGSCKLLGSVDTSMLGRSSRSSGSAVRP